MDLGIFLSGIPMLICLLLKYVNASRATPEVRGCGHTDNARGADQKYKGGYYTKPS